MSFTVGRGGVAVAVAFALSVGAVSLAHAQTPVAPATVTVSGMSKAQVLAAASAPLPANLTDEQMVEAVKERVEILAQAVAAGIISPTELREGVRDLVLVNRAVAGAVVTALVTVGQQGVPGASPQNLTVALGAGVGLAASELTSTVSSSGSGGISTSDTSATQALESITTALTVTNAISGSFGTSYTVALNQTGNTLIAQAAVTNSGSDAGASDPNSTVIPATPQTPTNAVSP